MLSPSVPALAQQPAGSIRGRVIDKDFDVPLVAVQVLAVETGQKTLTNDQGTYVLPEVQPGVYTLVFTKDGYTKQVRSGVQVEAGRLADIDVELVGEFTDMEEFVVQDLLQFGAGSEAALLQMRFESPALLDSIGSDLMSRAGAGDAASALRLVAGASVQGGKFAVIRGLPDRYVSSQMNGVRLPSADEDKRAVELDQFPATVLESIQVSKTFTPDQQGDASGGAVNVRLKGIPGEYIFQFKAQASYNTQVTGASNFLTYKGGGVDFWGRDDGGRDIQTDNIGGNWTGAVGVERTSAPEDYKWSLAYGNRTDIGGGVRLGGYASLFYERDSTHDDDRRDDSYWVENPGGGMVPQTNQGSSTGGDFKTALFDITRSTQSVQLGGLGILGLETDEQSIALTALYTRNTEDSATLAEDTRGKAYFFPGYDPNNPQGTGNEPSNVDAAPYLRLETLQYTERTTGTLQLTGKHKLGEGSSELGDSISLKPPEFEWTLSHSTADLNQPDKRQFGALWHAASYHPGVPPFTDPYTDPPIWLPYKPGANFNFGNLQRIWKTIGEDSDQVSLNLKFPFEQWDDRKGSLKLGFFDDSLHREYDQRSFGNFGDSGSFLGDWSDDWADSFPSEDHPITESTYDVNYRGRQDVTAWYSMLDLPLTSALTLTGGARVESTTIGIVNIPGPDATWYPPGTDVPVALNPGDADVTYHQRDVLPAIALSLEAVKDLTLRASYSQTVAHQTFKELTPIAQQEYLGGPVFIGNPDLRMSSLENYDLRADYVPYEGGLLSVSWFQKNITDTIEYVQRVANSVTFTTPVNYPEGVLYGYEFEVRQDLEHAWSALHGLSAGANATFIHSRATLPASEAAGFSDPGILAPMSTRDMTDAPEHLYNFFLTYDFEGVDTQLSAFYTVQGDTLVAGAGESLGNFVPSLYAKEYDTLNLSLTHGFGKSVKLTLQAKNLTNPAIEEVYRSPYIGADVTKTSYTKGIEFSLGLTVSF